MFLVGRSVIIPRIKSGANLKFGVGGWGDERTGLEGGKKGSVGMV